MVNAVTINSIDLTSLVIQMIPMIFVLCGTKSQERRSASIPLGSTIWILMSN